MLLSCASDARIVCVRLFVVFASDAHACIAASNHALRPQDFGWSYGFHRNGTSREVVTPNLDALGRAGVVLDRFYTYKFCSPTRSSLQSGRLPVNGTSCVHGVEREGGNAIG